MNTHQSMAHSEDIATGLSRLFARNSVLARGTDHHRILRGFADRGPMPMTIAEQAFPGIDVKARVGELIVAGYMTGTARDGQLIYELNKAWEPKSK